MEIIEFKQKKTGDKINFTLLSEGCTNERACWDEQLKTRWNPAGYGFYGFKTYRVEGEMFLSTWWASDYCD